MNERTNEKKWKSPTTNEAEKYWQTHTFTYYDRHNCLTVSEWESKMVVNDDECVM